MAGSKLTQLLFRHIISAEDNFCMGIKNKSGRSNTELIVLFFYVTENIYSCIIYTLNHYKTKLYKSEFVHMYLHGTIFTI